MDGWYDIVSVVSGEFWVGNLVWSMIDRDFINTAEKYGWICLADF